MINTELLAKAKNLPHKPKRTEKVTEYLDVIKVLKEKNYTWAEVAKFLKEEGVVFNPSYLCTQYKKKMK